MAYSQNWRDNVGTGLQELLLQHQSKVNGLC